MSKERICVRLLCVYNLLVAGMAIWLMLCIFPSTEVLVEPLKTVSNAEGTTATQWLNLSKLQFGAATIGDFTLIPALTPDRGLPLLALLAGILGSFLHSSGSLAAYAGDQRFETSWALWYVLRLPMGAVLGLLFYFVLRAGLVTTNDSSVSAYGVVAFGGLAGWFSKKATDKMAELFETLFRTRQPAEYTGKQHGAVPLITTVEPSRIPSGATDVLLTIKGTGFSDGVKVLLDGFVLATERESSEIVKATIPAERRQGAGDRNLTLRNPEPYSRESAPYRLTFE